MIRQTQATSSGANERRIAYGVDRLGRESGDDARSPAFGGRGVFAIGRRHSALALPLALLAFFLMVQGSHAKVVVDGFGTSGSAGGQFQQPRGIAINHTGAGGVAAGTIYIVDSQNRVERFSPSGQFERAWGQDVVTGGVTTFEICTVAGECKAGSISGTTANGGQLNNPQGVAINQSTGTVYVSEIGNRRISQFDANGNFVRTWGWDVVSTGKPNNVGTEAFEVCDTTAGNVAADCKQAAANGDDGGRFGGNVGYPITDAAGAVWIPDAINRRIQKFTAAGGFIAAYGYDVDALGGSGELEECTSLVLNGCQAGTSGSELGQFSNFNPRDIDFDSAGNVYALDSGNARVQKFNPNLTSVSTLDNLLFAPYTSSAPERILATRGGERLIFGVNNNVSASERQILEFDVAEEEFTDVSLVGSGLNNLSGLAENEETETLYATTTSNTSPRRVIVLRDTPQPDPGKTLDPITTKTDTTATFTGSVDPVGGLVECAFEYSTDQIEWTDVPEGACESLAPGGGPQPVAESVTGLLPNQRYYVRLAVSRPLVAGSTQTTAVEEFDTDAVPPVISTVGAVQITDTSMRLVGTIDPRHADTQYVFRYGSSPTMESSTESVGIGNSATPLVVSRVIEGLSPGTEYFFALESTNLAGTSTSETATAVTRTTPLPLPDDRRWEQVSPADKNYNDAEFQNVAGHLAPDGNGASFAAFGNFGTPPGQTIIFFAPYASRRTDHGWQSGAVIPPFCAFDSNSTVNFGYAQPNGAVDLNVEHAVIGIGEFDACEIDRLDPTAPTPAENLYLEDLKTDPFRVDDFTLLASKLASNNPNLKTPTGSFTGGSVDFGTVVYTSSGQQTSDVPDDGVTRLFAWHDGELSVVGREPQTNALFETSTALVVNSGGLLAFSASDDRAVSDDGERIFFKAPSTGQGQQIYMRESSTTTYHVTKPECSSITCTESNPTFEAATADGSKVLFTTNATLNDEDEQSGKDLYLYSHTADAEDEGVLNLRLVSTDEEPADGTNGTVMGFYGMSSDAQTIYFVASGQLVPGETTDPGPKLYRWQWNEGSPTTEFLVKLASSGQETARWGASTNGQVTPSGNALVLATPDRLTPAADQDSDTDVYHWAVGEGWSCVSCQLPGAESFGDSKTAPQAASQISNDGMRIPFTSADALVPDDINGEVNGVPSCPSVKNLPVCQDVYEWHDGRVSLISDGRSTQASKLHGISESGRDILFITYDRLVGWDFDSNSDLYDARIGGGFPEPPIEGAPCEGESCRSAGTSAPPLAGAGTAVFEGPGNRSEPARCGKGYRKVTVRGRSACQKKGQKKRCKKGFRKVNVRGRTVCRRRHKKARCPKKRARQKRRCGTKGNRAYTRQHPIATDSRRDVR